ncbi:MAG: hypothetical protein HZA02_01625 [Nitrospinae bacterium]|nr:hypothetical protein [Nitrospinota bacterium]
MKDIEGFKEWYAERQAGLKNDPLARFFHRFRNINHHIGENIVNSGSMRQGNFIKWFFCPVADIQTVPEEDVEKVCKAYFVQLLELVYQCYQSFGPHIDAQQYFTAENFGRTGKTIDDADEEITGIRGWTEVPGIEEERRWEMLRKSVLGCEINQIFEEYLGKTVNII